MENDHATFRSAVELKKSAHLMNGFSHHIENLQSPRLKDDEFATIAVRNLVHDLCMQNGGGHGGSALGMAAIGVALWKYEMRYNPLDPNWFDRDRFVLSNGMTLYQCWKIS